MAIRKNKTTRPVGRAPEKLLPQLIELLAKHYEEPERKLDLTEIRDPFQLGAWFIMGQHAKRNGQFRAFEALRRARGLTPGALLDLPPEKLATICQIAGPYEDARARDLYAFADAVEEKCGQDLGKVFKNPLPAVRKFLENDLGRSPAFVDFLLLYAGRFPVFALDLPAARAAVRLGFGSMRFDREFEQAYCGIQRALTAQSPEDAEWLVRAHALLHRLGVALCHSVSPDCADCPLAALCPYLKKNPLKTKPLAPSGTGPALGVPGQIK